MLGCLKPAVHVAYGAGHDVSPGVFDLIDPVSAVRLAQFIIGLQAHFHTIADSAMRSLVAPRSTFSWRSDLVPFNDISGEQWRDRVTRWARDVHTGRSKYVTHHVIRRDRLD